MNVKKPKPSNERQAAYRGKGRQIAVVLRDPEALQALDLLSAKHGGVTAAVTFALHASISHARLTTAGTCPFPRAASSPTTAATPSAGSRNMGTLTDP